MTDPTSGRRLLELTCSECPKVFFRVKHQTTCSQTCHQIRRRRVRFERQTHPVLGHGLADRPEICPKCRAAIRPHDHEPAFTRCWTCGALWPIRGGDVEAQRVFETASGLWSR